MFYRQNHEGYKVLAEGVRLKSLAHGEKTHLCEFRITKGGRVPEHSHPHEQTGYLISGRVRLIVGDQTFEAGPGDSWSLPGNVAHAADVLEDSVMVEVFSPCREDYLV